MKKKLLLGIAALALVAGLAAYLVNRSDPADTRFTGAYLLPDGKVLRYRMMNGESGVLWPTANAEFEGGPGWAEREPVVNHVKFDSTGDARKGFDWRRADDKIVHARRLDLPERIAKFPSGELSLRGKVVLPDSSKWGPGPFPAVVIVHGSEADSAVDYYSEPYIYAANGFASLVFDKRGTGESQGKYLQNFHVLSDDVVAAVQWLRAQPGIDGDRIHLAGFSQGGWIAPLAALKDGNIRSVLVGYGVMVPVTGEDRWGYFYALQQKGFGADAVASADRINAVIGDIMDRQQNRWSDLGTMLDAARSQPWFAGVRGSDSALGVITDSKLPLWTMRVYLWWRMGSQGGTPFIDRLYDPVTTMHKLQTPSFWILGGADSSAPTPWTLRELEKLQAEGRPVQYRVFPEADHGILKFVQQQGGERRYTGLEPDYYPAQIAWLREHSGS
jgi:uncharacterized protein